MSAQHFPSLPEDVTGKRVSLLCTWGNGGGKKGAGEYLGGGLSWVILSLEQGSNLRS
jgi:hypothetical protein